MLLQGGPGIEMALLRAANNERRRSNAKRKKGIYNDLVRGGLYVHVAVNPVTKAIVTAYVGDRTMDPKKFKKI